MAKTGLEDRYLVAIRSLLQRVMDERGFKQADAGTQVGGPVSLTDDETFAVLKSLTERDTHCPICRSREFVVQGPVKLVIEPDTMHLQAHIIQSGGPHLPCAAVICRTCGFTFLMNLFVTKALTPETPSG